MKIRAWVAPKSAESSLMSFGGVTLAGWKRSLAACATTIFQSLMLAQNNSGGAWGFWSSSIRGIGEDYAISGLPWPNSVRPFHVQGCASFHGPPGSVDHGTGNVSWGRFRGWTVIAVHGQRRAGLAALSMSGLGRLLRLHRQGVGSTRATLDGSLPLNPHAVAIHGAMH